MASEDEAQSPDSGSSPYEPDVAAYREYLALLEARLFANSEAYDRALLTLSSAFLLVSVTFISDVVTLSEADHLWLLRSSWLLLVAAILTVLFSFQVGNLMAGELRQGARLYFLEGQDGELEVSKTLSRRMERLNWATGGMFASGVVILTLFVVVNLPTQEAEVDKREIIERGQPLPSFDQVPSAAQPQQQQQQQQPSQSQESSVPQQENK